MNILAIVRVVAILCSGLMAGLMFGDRMGPAFARQALSASSFVQQQQIIHIHYVRLLPVLSLSSIVGALVWLFLARARWNGAEFWLVLLAVVAIAVAAALTVRVNFPINAELMTWTAAAPPDNWKEIWSRWENVHTVRTLLWVGAFALEVAALGLFASKITSLNT